MVLRHKEDPDLPVAIENGSTLRHAVWGLASEKDLIKLDDKISDYEPYLENYFLNLSCNKTNFFTDISNYLSYEKGQPQNCFDSKKIKISFHRY